MNEKEIGRLMQSWLRKTQTTRPATCAAWCLVLMADEGQIDPAAEGDRERVAALVAVARAMVSLSQGRPMIRDEAKSNA